MTQSAAILSALSSGPLTPLDALDRFGCFRLAARIDELRQQGHQIDTFRRKLPSGKTVAEYRLIKMS